MAEEVKVNHDTTVVSPAAVNQDNIAVVPVKDLDAAKDFYGNKLGLKVVTSDEDGIQYKYGNTQLVIHKTNEPKEDRATVVTWQAANLAEVVASLKSKGITFEHYTMRNVTMEGEDIHLFEDGVRAVWFKDPDGNVLEVDQLK